MPVCKSQMRLNCHLRPEACLGLSVSLSLYCYALLCMSSRCVMMLLGHLIVSSSGFGD